MNKNRTKQNSEISTRDKENCIVTEELIVNKENTKKVYENRTNLKQDSKILQVVKRTFDAESIIRDNTGEQQRLDLEQYQRGVK